MRHFFHFALRNIKERKLRSFLTVSGIIISIASIVALVYLSNGLTNAIEEQFEKIGSNRVYVMAGHGAQLKEGLTTRDVETLEKLNFFEYVTPYLVEPAAEVSFSNEEQFATITAFPADDVDKRLADYDFTFSEGRGFGEDERYGAMVGSLAAVDLFRKDMHARNSIYINDQKFEILGILESFGNNQDDMSIYIPLETAREVFENVNEVSFIEGTVKKGVDLNLVKSRLERELKRVRDNENFSVLTPDQILKFLSNILAIVQGILVSIAAVSLLVGAIGIMNSMYTSVLERTKEIGIMKSVGARNNDIMLIFLIEAGIIGLIGGTIGLIIGTGLSFMIEKVAINAGFLILKIKFDYFITIGALGFATFIGMISGLLPSRQAALLHPVDALRWTK